MPNHCHLLVRLYTDRPGNAIMQPFGVSFTKAINQQQKRVGPLFQGPFEARGVDYYGYLIHLTRYIHLNPAKAGLVLDPLDWPYSSYREYAGRRPGTLPHPAAILDQFGSPAEYVAFVHDDTVDESITDHLMMD